MNINTFIWLSIYSASFHIYGVRVIAGNITELLENLEASLPVETIGAWKMTCICYSNRPSPKDDTYMFINNYLCVQYVNMSKQVHVHNIWRHVVDTKSLHTWWAPHIFQIQEFEWFCTLASLQHRRYSAWLYHCHSSPYISSIKDIYHSLHYFSTSKQTPVLHI